LNLRAFVPLVLLGCTSTEVVAPQSALSLMQTTNGDTIRVPAARGGFVDLGPNATLHFENGDVQAADVYWNETGIFSRDGTFLGSWDNLGAVKIEQIDGAASVAVTAAAAVIVVAMVAMLAGAGKGGGGGGGGGGHGGGHGGGSGHSGGGASPSHTNTPTTHWRSAPNPSGEAVDPLLPVDIALRTAEVLVQPPVVGVGVGAGTLDVDPGVPLFSRDARRRAQVRVLGRLEGGFCWPAGPNTDCAVGGARVGVRLYELFEMTAGLRTETANGVTQPLAVGGIMVHGESPGLHWLAIALGASVAFDGNRAHIVPTFGIRFRPVRGLWLGLVPVQPVYATETGNWNMASGIEITGEL
jgi:hypothetical protein